MTWKEVRTSPPWICPVDMVYSDGTLLQENELFRLPLRDVQVGIHALRIDEFCTEMGTSKIGKSPDRGHVGPREDRTTVGAGCVLL